MAQLGPLVPRIRSLGAELLIVGNGTTAMAQAFLEDHPIDAKVYVDPKRTSYKAAGLKRSMAATLSPAQAPAVIRAAAAGHMQGRVQGDPWQLGGTFVVWPGGVVAYSHLNESASDHPDAEAVLKALAQRPP